MDRLEREWIDFREKNPGLIADLARVARRLIANARAAGREPRRIGIGLIWEVARFEGLAVNADGTPYVWNNSHRALAARALSRVDPEIGKLMRTRARRTERVTAKRARRREQEERAYAGRLV